MTQPNILEQAKKGDPKAISSLLNRLLINQRISAEATLQDNCLLVWLKSHQIPNQTTLVAFMRQSMTKLGASTIKKVKIYAQQVDEDFPCWEAEFDLEYLNTNLEQARTVTSNTHTQTQLQLKQLASLGNVEAITSILNNAFQKQNIKPTKISIVKDTLQILLESAEIPNQSLSTAILRKELVRLKIESIRIVKVYGRELQQEIPAWFQQFEVGVCKLTPVIPVKSAPNTEFLATLRTFKFESIVPLKDVLSDNLYNSNTVRLLLLFGLFPLAVSLIARTSGLGSIAFILGIYYSSIWGVVLYDLLKPTVFSWTTTVKCSFFTVLVGIPILLFLQKVPPFTLLYTAVRQEGIIPQLIGFILGVGVLEESCKALPIYLFLLRTGKLKDPLTSAFYGAMSGLGFAVAEGVGYSYRYAESLVRGQSDFGFYVLINTIRFVSLPLYHAIWAGICGYFIGLAAINPSRQGSIIFIGLTVSAVLHGCYNTFSNSIIGFGILAFSILLFVTYLNRSQQIVSEMEKAEQEGF
ncbi:MAG: PrsW family intramembrane metalloprotease [Calothrix sp. C42_A2020_038]|nr:PrsW family intramembrane metalloprotease [Calothrix sp. C42_A2020_038]